MGQRTPHPAFPAHRSQHPRRGSPTSPKSEPSSISTVPRLLADSDGYPDNWYVPGKSAVYHYPNHQDAAMLWYHDHALGINRLNVFAGLLGAYILRDDVEDSLNLPSGKYEIPLVVLRSHLRSRKPAQLSRVGQSEIAVDARSFRRCLHRQRQALSLSRSRAAPVSLPRVKWRQRPLLSFVAVERPVLPPDRHRPGPAPGATSNSSD